MRAAIPGDTTSWTATPREHRLMLTTGGTWVGSTCPIRLPPLGSHHHSVGCILVPHNSTSTHCIRCWKSAAVAPSVTAPAPPPQSTSSARGILTLRPPRPFQIPAVDGQFRTDQRRDGTSCSCAPSLSATFAR